MAPEDETSLTGYTGDIFDLLYSITYDIIKFKIDGVISVSGLATYPAGTAKPHLYGAMADNIIKQFRCAITEILKPTPSSKPLDPVGNPADFFIEPTLSFQPDPQITDDSSGILKYKDKVTKGQQGQGGPAPLTDEEYVQLARQLEERSHAFRQQLAIELAPALNARIREMPRDTYEEKKELARWVNNQLEPLGLAVQCPNTGLPAKLRSQTGNWPGVGRFAFEVYSDGKRRTPSVSDKLPELTLIDATPHKDTEVKWQQTVGTQHSVQLDGPAPESFAGRVTDPRPIDAPYADQANQIEGLVGDVRQEVAARLLPALKGEMKARPHDTYERKVDLVRWVNAELRRFGMAVRHPKTGEGATLNPYHGNHPEIGSFELRGKDAEGRVKTFTTPDLDTLLDNLELIDAPARREALAEWQAKVGHQRRGAKRG